jgi:hypothetical protein
MRLLPDGDPAKDREIRGRTKARSNGRDTLISNQRVLADLRDSANRHDAEISGSRPGFFLTSASP